MPAAVAARNPNSKMKDGSGMLQRNVLYMAQDCEAVDEFGGTSAEAVGGQATRHFDDWLNLGDAGLRPFRLVRGGRLLLHGLLC